MSYTGVGQSARRCVAGTMRPIAGIAEEEEEEPGGEGGDPFREGENIVEGELGSDEGENGMRVPKAMARPIEPTAQERNQHETTHLPYRS